MYLLSGNLVSDTRPGAITATTGYDGYARLTSYARTGESSLSFTYNGMDDRVREVRGSTTRRYIYDGAGRVMGEYGTSATNVIAEHLWLSPDAANDNMPFGGEDGVGGYAPLAVVNGTTLSWVHASHIGVPLVYTNSAGTAVATPSYTLPGFPGQMKTFADLYYNRYRDYDPTTGRYIQADPIGLAGDPNPYAYAGGNPVNRVDPTGEFGLPGAAGGAGLSFVLQLSANYIATGDLRRSLRCIDYGDVLVSAAAGFLGPTFIGNVVRGAPGPFGLTRTQSAVSYFSTFLPGSAVFKLATPSLLIGKSCECSDLGLSATVSAITQF